MPKSDYIYFDTESEKRKGFAAIVAIFILGVAIGILLMKFVF
jgi:hypothetical protein